MRLFNSIKSGFASPFSPQSNPSLDSNAFRNQLQTISIASRRFENNTNEIQGEYQQNLQYSLKAYRDKISKDLKETK
jgi:hypothetical protein